MLYLTDFGLVTSESVTVTSLDSYLIKLGYRLYRL